MRNRSQRTTAWHCLETHRPKHAGKHYSCVLNTESRDESIRSDPDRRTSLEQVLDHASRRSKICQTRRSNGETEQEDRIDVLFPMADFGSHPAFFPTQLATPFACLLNSHFPELSALKNWLVDSDENHPPHHRMQGSTDRNADFSPRRGKPVR